MAQISTRSPKPSPQTFVAPAEAFVTVIESPGGHYRDLQDGFAALRKGETANALWQWKFGFDTHRSKHAAEAIYALYNVRSSLVE